MSTYIVMTIFNLFVTHTHNCTGLAHCKYQWNGKPRSQARVVGCACIYTECISSYVGVNITIWQDVIAYNHIHNDVAWYGVK